MSATEAIVFSPVTAIIAMSVATLMLRGGGFWLMGHIPLTPRIRRVLAVLPGCIVVAIVLPIMIQTGMAAFAAIAVVVLVMLWLRNDALAVVAGVAAAALVRAAGF